MWKMKKALEIKTVRTRHQAINTFSVQLQGENIWSIEKEEVPYFKNLFLISIENMITPHTFL